MIRIAQKGTKERKAARPLEVTFDEFNTIMTKID